MRAVLEARSERTPVSRSHAPKVNAAGAEGRQRILGAARWGVWVPILTRALACGLALLGLAGIGMAASRSPAVSAIAEAPLGVTLAQLAGPPLGSAAPLGVTLAPGEVSPSASPVPAAPAPAPDLSAARPGREASGAPEGTAPSSPCPKSSPARSEPGASENGTQSGSRVGGVLADGRVVLNLASAIELRRLPGVGTKRAEAIVALRQRLGRFKRASDLLRIKGIGPRTFERMLPKLVLNPP